MTNFDNVLIEDLLTFDTDNQFVQELTTYPTDDCDSNDVTWQGSYDQDGSTVLDMSFKQCAIDSVGCLKCSPTFLAELALNFEPACDVVVMTTSNDTVRTYFAV